MDKQLTFNPSILLHPNIPKPLHGLNPRTILGDQWWNQKRQIAYKTKDYKCWACGMHKKDALYHKWLEAHECYEFHYCNGTAKMIEITALCHSCHNYIHCGRMTHLLRAGKMTMDKLNKILEHGDALTKDISRKNNPYIINESSFAEWGEWRLIIEGKEYFSKFKDYDDWEEHYKG